MMRFRSRADLAWKAPGSNATLRLKHGPEPALVTVSLVAQSGTQPANASLVLAHGRRRAYEPAAAQC
jgi:hypothetical protein